VIFPKNAFAECVLIPESLKKINAKCKRQTHISAFSAHYLSCSIINVPLVRLYVPARLHRRIDDIAAVIRGPIAAQSAFRLDKFEQAVGLKPVHPSPGESADSFNWPAPEMKRFIDNRALSVRRQLDGKSKGMILKFPEEK
jgi:hypothetical protein